MKTTKQIAKLALLLMAMGSASVLATLPEDRPLLHPLFADHMVLQRDQRVPVWGWAAPDTRVTVEFAGQTKRAVAGGDGRWEVRLGRMRASSEPRALRASTDSGGRTVTVKDVLVGDVWLCSGQSNMEMGIGQCEVSGDIAAADFPEIRLLTVPKRIRTRPDDLLVCHWVRCSPESLAKEGTWGGFTAAGFFFGRELYRQLNIPIGLIQSAWGGTVAEAWTSAEGLEPLGDFDTGLARVQELNNPARKVEYPAVFEAWCQQEDPGSQQGWSGTIDDETDWARVEMPRVFEKSGLPGFDGIVWFRRSFEVPSTWLGEELELNLGPIDDVDTTWINGVWIGQMNRYDLVRHYRVPPGTVKPGTNLLTVRVLDTGGDGGFTGKANQLAVQPADNPSAAPVSLAGDWWMRSSAPLSALSTPPQAPDPNNPNVPTVLYNGMIAPLVPFSIKGAIWYQGESNADRAAQYRRLLPAMIRDWRTHFREGDFPFYIVQLAAWQQTNAVPRDNAWAELREAQALTARKVRNCGLAVAIDIGDAGDIHPKDKRNVGDRLALCALAETYHKKVEFSGPWYRSMKITKEGIRLRFDHVDGGLVAKDGPLTGFAVAGEDRRFVWAEARIEGDSVWVTSPQVSRPVAVRYAWDINPNCNLYNLAGLPAVPFRTDDWPLTTRNQ